MISRPNILLFFILIFIASCKEDDGVHEYGYPQGISIVDMDTPNDCTLHECSEDRIVRLVADDVKGEIFKSSSTGIHAVSYTFTIDSKISLYFCNLPDDFKVEGMKVSFSGELLDACGYIEPIWPVEETYMVRLSDIEEQ